MISRKQFPWHPGAYCVSHLKYHQDITLIFLFWLTQVIHLTKHVYGCYHFNKEFNLNQTHSNGGREVTQVPLDEMLSFVYESCYTFGLFHKTFVCCYWRGLVYRTIRINSTECFLEVSSTSPQGAIEWTSSIYHFIT